MSPLPINYKSNNHGNISASDGNNPVLPDQNQVAMPLGDSPANNSQADVATPSTPIPTGSPLRKTGVGIGGGGLGLPTLTEDFQENTPLIIPEKSAILEKVAIPEDPKPVKKISTSSAHKDAPDQTSIPETNLKDHLVDKTAEPIKTHEIEDTTDALTKKADEDEQHFIEEVEKRHGRI